MISLKGPDGLGFYYGTVDGCHINVREEGPIAPNVPHLRWWIYINGTHVGAAPSKEEAEKAALEWLELPYSEAHG